MSDWIKGFTVALIVIALYLAVKGRQARQILTQAAQLPPCPNPQNVINNLPMESANCAIPLASDYLCAPHCHVPAVSPITQRASRILPILRQPSATYPISRNSSAGGSRMATTPPTCGLGMARGVCTCTPGQCRIELCGAGPCAPCSQICYQLIATPTCTSNPI